MSETNVTNISPIIEGVSDAPKRTRGPNKPKPLSPTQGVLLEVLEEREKQDAKWGEQNHPLLGGDIPASALSYYAVRADNWKAINDQRVSKAKMGWDSIALEEVYEALAESDPAKAREEYVQLAAVAVAAIECIDRRAAKQAA